MIQLLLIEDETAVQKDILGLLRMIGNVEILQVIDNVQEAISVLPDTMASLVLMDIQLKDGTAFDILSQIPTPHFNIVFITAHEQYAINAIKVGALDYLLKPVDPGELKAALYKAGKELPQQEQINVALTASKANTDRIVLKNTEGIHFVMFSELLYCRSDNAYTHFHNSDGKSIMVSKSIKEYEKLLPEHEFIRCHQSYLVNKVFIKKIDRNGFLELKNGVTVPVSDRKKEQVIKAMMQ